MESPQPDQRQGADSWEGYGIQQWQLGKIVRVQRAATTVGELVVHAVVALAIGFAVGCLTVTVFEVQDDSVPFWWKWLAGIVCGAALSTLWTWWQSRVGELIELDWSAQTIRVRQSRKTVEYVFDDVGEVSLSGEYNEARDLSSSSGVGTRPPTWQARVELALKDGQLVPVLEGTVVEGGDERPVESLAPAEEAYHELLQPCMQLADSLGVSWRWCGFEGHQ